MGMKTFKGRWIQQSKLETTQLSSNSKMNKENMAESYEGILYSSENEQTTASHMSGSHKHNGK